jgi:hypothetical protein
MEFLFYILSLEITFFAGITWNSHNYLASVPLMIISPICLIAYGEFYKKTN